jgi:cephalosporin-C deacetylase-like acetyl esterase
VQDVVRSLDYSLSRPDVDPSRVRVVGRGMGALWTLFAAALDTRIQTAVCESGLLSYGELCRSDRYLHGANVFVPNILSHFDLPQVAAAIADRSLTLVAPVDAMKRPVRPEGAENAYAWTRAVYAAAGAQDRFRILDKLPA